MSGNIKIDCQFDFERRASDGLDVGGQFQFWELMDLLVNGLAQLGGADEFAHFR